MPAYRYEDLTKYVLLDVPGCPLNVRLKAMGWAAREICVKSGIWREWLAMAAVAGKTAYDLQPAWDAEVERIVSVQVDGAQIGKSFYRLDEGSRLVFDQDQQPSSSTSVSAFSSSSTYALNAQVSHNGFYWKCVNAVTSAGAWDEADWQWDDSVGVWVRVVLRPSYDADELPDWIVERCAEGIISGAKSKIMLEPKRPWSDVNLAAYHEQRFNGYLNRACVEAARQACFDEGYGYRKFSMDMGA